jgi:hypothetical protein
MNELVAAKVEIGDRKYNEIIAPHRSAITAATQRAAQARAEILGNAELLFAWERAVKGGGPPSDDSTAPAAAAEDPVEQYIERWEQFVKMNQDFCSVLVSAVDRASAQAAGEQVQTKLPEYERTVRQMTAGVGTAHERLC